MGIALTIGIGLLVTVMVSWCAYEVGFADGSCSVWVEKNYSENGDVWEAEDEDGNKVEVQ